MCGHPKIVAVRAPQLRGSCWNNCSSSDTGFGDLVWQLDGITLREERPWITRRGSDSDVEGNRENLLRIVALKDSLPELIIVPAHDMRAFAEMPRLSREQRDRR